MTSDWVEVYIGLGSNLGNPAKELLQACESLRPLSATGEVRRSSLYQSKAIGPAQPDYLNAVAQFATHLSPTELLRACQKIETNQKRVRQERWGPRTIDLDIILYGQEQIHQQDLSIPHIEMKNRNFVVIPLNELAKDLILPDGTPLEELAKKLGMKDLEKLPEDSIPCLLN